jgi:putative transposase
VVTRGNGRATVFHTDVDYQIFVQLAEQARTRFPVEIFAWCLMPNHVHLVIRPFADGDLSRFMHWILTTHVQRHRVRYRTTGRLWQGRYKAFPVQVDRHLLAVLRYVERNPVRADLASSAVDWAWSSASERLRAGHSGLSLDPSPVPLPDPWLEWVNAPFPDDDLAKIRTSLKRDRPLGDSAWTRGLAERLELLGTLAPRGRPRIL